MRKESDFSDWSDDSELSDVCGWLLVVLALLVQARSTMRVNISVMCFILCVV